MSRPRLEDAAAGVEFLDGILEPGLKRILLPLLEAPEYVLDQGRGLFGIESPTLEATIRDLLRSSDPWLRACALAAAAELKLRSLAPDVAHAAAEADERVSEVAPSRFNKARRSLRSIHAKTQHR